MTGKLHAELCSQLLRSDGQEDIRLITYAPSTGQHRRTAVLNEIVAPWPSDREVHGNATIHSSYLLRAAGLAAATGLGVAMAHSHPAASRWQNMSAPDQDAERSYGNLIREITGHPLVGLTLAGADHTWSARHWDTGAGIDLQPTHSSSVRVIGNTLGVSWNDSIVPPPSPGRRQQRTVSAWGSEIQADLARRRVLVVGLGSVGLDVALRLAATGFIDIGLMDFDRVEPVNLDRLIGATALDAALRRPKVKLAHRLVSRQSTAAAPTISAHNNSICEPEGVAIALDYDIIFSCVDRPWPRAVLNTIAYSDLIPIIDGGIAIDAFADKGMRNASWRSHVIGPGRPCLVCNRQLDPAEVPLDIEGLLDDPSYIVGTSTRGPTGAPNVAILSISASASLLAQFVSLNIAPGGTGDPGPLRYLLSTHTLEHINLDPLPNCPTEQSTASGDQRIPMADVTRQPGRRCRQRWRHRERR